MQTFIKRYKKAVAGKSKAMTLSMSEAAGILTAYASSKANNLLMGELLQEVKKLRIEVKKLSTNNSNNSIQGGKF